jgi:hypothetical protein
MPAPPPLAAGQVDTPPALAAALAAGLLAPGGVLDPACGEGALLVAAWEASGRSPSVAGRLAGIELDPERARRARARLRRALGGALGRAAAGRIREGDALLHEALWTPGTAILANPPWASLSGRGALRLPAGLRAAYRAAHASLCTGWPSLHGAFLERIARHVAREGTAARVLAPAPVLDRERYAPLRELLRGLVRLEGALALGAGAFRGVSESAVLLSLAPRLAGEADGPGWAPEGLARELEQRLRAHPRLPAAAFGDTGVHTGNAAADLVARGAGPGEPLREGRDLLPYRLGPPSARLRVEHAAKPGQRFRIGPWERYRDVPVLVRQTADRPLAALHREPAYFRNTLLACRPPPALDPAFVVGVLNSGVAALWHRARHADARQTVFPQVKVAHLRGLPFPFAERRAAPALHDEIARRVRALEAGALEEAAVEGLVREAYELAGALPS